MCYAIRLDKMVPLSNVTKQGGSQSRTSSEMITVGTRECKREHMTMHHKHTEKTSFRREEKN